MERKEPSKLRFERRSERNYRGGREKEGHRGEEATIKKDTSEKIYRRKERREEKRSL